LHVTARTSPPAQRGTSRAAARAGDRSVCDPRLRAAVDGAARARCEHLEGLLYHYFPSKRRLFEDVTAEGAEELRARTEPDPSKSAAEQLNAALDAFLASVQERPAAYATLLESAGSSEVREIMADVRATTAARILAELGDDGERPATRAAASGWLGFLDAAILDWIAHDWDLSRQELHGLLLGSFAGALMACGAGAALTG
jgi:AcrR family transcriptional regulator